jgi:hypothetical protein
MKNLIFVGLIAMIMVGLLAAPVLAKSPLLKKHEAEMAAYDRQMVALKAKTEAARKAREDKEALNNAIGKVLFLPFRPLVMAGMYLSKFVTGLSKGDLKAPAQATFMVVVSPLNLVVATAGDLVTLTKKKSPYGPTPYKPSEKEAITPPF